MIASYSLLSTSTAKDKADLIDDGVPEGLGAIVGCCILKQLSAFGGDETPKPIVPTI